MGFKVGDMVIPISGYYTGQIGTVIEDNDVGYGVNFGTKDKPSVNFYGWGDRGKLLSLDDALTLRDALAKIQLPKLKWTYNHGRWETAYNGTFIALDYDRNYNLFVRYFRDGATDPRYATTESLRGQAMFKADEIPSMLIDAEKQILKILGYDN